MSERVQTKPLERWVGQTVYRSVRPTHGPYSFKTVALRRGKIMDIFEDKKHNFKNEHQMHLTYYDVDINWYTLQVMRPPIPEPFEHNKHYSPRVDAPFNYGLKTVFECSIFCQGGLIGADGPSYTEPQPKELIDLLPLYRQIVMNPDKEFYPHPDFEHLIREKSDVDG